MWTFLTSSLSLACGILLMFVILLQRGRGGGLAGAFGGLGGQSAFGTKAGDVFTRITIVLAVVWVLLNAATIYAMRFESEGRYSGGTAANADEEPGISSKEDDKSSDAQPFDFAEPAKKDEAKSDDKSAKESKSAPESKEGDAKPAPETKAEDAKPAPTEGTEKKAETPAVAPANPEAPKEPGK